MPENQFDPSTLRRLWEIERGDESEKKAKVAIGGLDWVESVSQSQRYSFKDMAMQDLTVRTYSLVDPLAEIYVQVKSSRIGIYEAVEGLRDRVGGSLSRLEELLLDRRLIFVNGQESTESIQKQFTLQWELMKRHYIRRLSLEPGTLLIPNGERRRLIPLGSEDFIQSWVLGRGWKIEYGEPVENDYGRYSHSIGIVRPDAIASALVLGIDGDSPHDARRNAIISAVNSAEEAPERIAQFRKEIALFEELFAARRHLFTDLIPGTRNGVSAALESIKSQGLRAQLLNLLSSSSLGNPITYDRVKLDLYNNSDDPLVDLWIRNVVSRTRQLLNKHGVHLVWQRDSGTFWLES